MLVGIDMITPVGYVQGKGCHTIPSPSTTPYVTKAQDLIAVV